MADQKDQEPHGPPPAALNEAQMESKPESETTIDAEFNEQTLEGLEKKAYYSVLQAFIAESRVATNKMNQMLEKLKKQWEISYATHQAFVDKIQTLQQSDGSSSSSDQKPLTEPAISSSSSVPEPRRSWGNVNPESLVGKWVRIWVHDLSKFVEFNITDYDSKLDKHHLLIPEGSGMAIDDPSSYFDIRDIPPEDIMWEGGVTPDFDEPKKPTLRRALF